MRFSHSNQVPGKRGSRTSGICRRKLAGQMDGNANLPGVTGELVGLASLPAPLSHDKSSCFRQSFGLTASPRLRNGLLDLRKKNDIAHIVKQR